MSNDGEIMSSEPSALPGNPEGHDTTGHVPHAVAVAARAADAKGGAGIVVLDVAAVSGITSYFVITSASNDRQVKAIVDEVEAKVNEECSERPLAVEGLDTRDWVLMNYGYFLVHVFSQEARDFYDLERLWRDAPQPQWT